MVPNLMQIATSASRKIGMSNRLMVGTDVMRIQGPRTKEVPNASFALPWDKDVTDILTKKYSDARRDAMSSVSMEQRGWSISVSTYDAAKAAKKDGTDATALKGAILDGATAGESAAEIASAEPAPQNGDRILTLKNVSTGEEISLTLKGDVRISFDDQNNPLIEQGGDIYDAKGALTTKSTEDILIRMTDAAVNGGDLSCALLNFSGKGGNIEAGKGGMRLYGNYEGATIKAGNAANLFAGVFTDCDIAGGDAANSFTGFFSGSTVSGGADKDSFSGFFLSNCTLDGKDGDDSFKGVYNRSVLRGGAGHNTFGSGRVASPNKVMDAEDLKGQFYNATIDASEGDSDIKGVFMYSNIIQGSGTHNLEGVFSNTTVDAGSGTSNITAYFAHLSSFTAEEGNHNFAMRTGTENRVSLGSGVNSVAMGIQTYDEQAKVAGRTLDLEGMNWYMPFNPKTGPGVPTSDGTLQKNMVDAREGVTKLFVNTKDSQESSVIKGKSAQEIEDGASTARTDGASRQWEKEDESTELALGGFGTGRDNAVRVINGGGQYRDYHQSDAARARRRKFISTFSSRA